MQILLAGNHSEHWLSAKQIKDLQLKFGHVCCHLQNNKPVVIHDISSESFSVWLFEQRG